tara:strand:- start:768 stop:1454 length:687 start_codon:yes stop_codon:yes gene_type:complete
MNRFISEIKKSYDDNISVAILGNETDYRVRSYGPKCLLKHGSSTIIQNQIKLIGETSCISDLVVVLGFECEKIINYIPEHVRIVENQLYSETNSSESLRLVINNICGDRLLIIDGNILISRNAFKKLDFSRSFALCHKNGKPKNEISASKIGDHIGNFSFGLENCWDGVVFLQGKEFGLLRKACTDKGKGRFFVFELLNLVIDNGGKIEIQECKAGDIKVINSIKDIA